MRDLGTDRLCDKDKYATMQVGHIYSGSSGLPSHCSRPAKRISISCLKRLDGADRWLRNISRRQDCLLPQLQDVHQNTGRLQQNSHSRSRVSCGSSGAASVLPASNSSAYIGSDDYRADRNKEIFHRNLTGGICVLLAFGCACACVAHGRAPLPFASLALSTSKMTEEGTVR